MTVLPNPFEDSVAPSSHAADTAAVSLNSEPLMEAAADPFNAEPLPLFMTDPAPELDRDIEAIVRVTFDLH